MADRSTLEILKVPPARGFGNKNLNNEVFKIGQKIAPKFEPVNINKQKLDYIKEQKLKRIEDKKIDETKVIELERK